MDIVKFYKKDLAENIDLFCELYRKTFTAVINKEIVEQRYLGNPYDELLMYVALDGGKIVANYSAVPLKLIIRGAEKKAALSLNTMTDPEYMGKGLFTTLAKALYMDLSNNNYSLILGFPNYISNRTFNSKLGWRTVYEIPTLKLSLDEVSDTNDVDILYSESFEDIEEDVKESLAHVSLTKEYLAWRFRDNLEKKYHVLAIDSSNWLIYQFYNEEVNITEINCADFDKEKMLINKLIMLSKSKHYKYVTTWCRTNTLSHCNMEKLGFRLSNPIRTFGLRCFDQSLEDFVYDYRNWRIQMGDDNTY